MKHVYLVYKTEREWGDNHWSDACNLAICSTEALAEIKRAQFEKEYPETQYCRVNIIIEEVEYFD